MTQAELKTFYAQRESQFAANLQKVNRDINVISNVRLAIALVFIVITYLGFSNYDLLYFLPVLILAFIILIRNHTRLFKKRNHLQNLVTINQSEQKALDGNFSSFQNGTEFIDSHHPYSHDLDIFGDGSLFQYLNRCNTIIGKEKLAERLKGALRSAGEILSIQESVKELAGKTDFRQHYQAAGMEIDELAGDRQQLLSWITMPSFLYGKTVYRFILGIIPALTITFVIASFLSTAFRPFAILLAAFQWAFLGFHIKRVNEFHDYISRKKNTLEKYANLLHHLQSEKFTAAYLKNIFNLANNADKKVRQLASLVRALDARMNSMMTLVVNSLLLYDLQCVYRLEKWKEENANNLQIWLQAASETEVLTSLGNFTFNNSAFSFPSISSEFSIAAQELGHPLIPPSECVVNNFKIGNGPTVLIITGANMAGKSTFLRTLGINLILALNGAPVCAKEFICPIIHLRTGMRTADSLKDHQSYFYAELDRLKGIMEELRSDTPLLILLDEILKGTNSTDKQAGSISLVKQLLPHPCLAIIATHDLALGDLENQFPGKVKNYHFEANIENDQLSFDYKLKPGIAQKMNATFLMKKMGIIPS